MKLTWYFDFISPFAYIQLSQLKRLPSNIVLEYKPVLLAGLLNHWQNIGPAEIPPKREFTYKYCLWLANRLNIPFRMPPAHPFNSLAALRMAIAGNNDPELITTIFEIIWQQGLALDSDEAIALLAGHPNLNELVTLSQSESVKLKLRENTELAANRSIFGVPTFAVNDQPNEQFWGVDAFDMLLDYINESPLFRTDSYRNLGNLPEAASRKR